MSKISSTGVRLLSCLQCISVEALWYLQDTIENRHVFPHVLSGYIYQHTTPGLFRRHICSHELTKEYSGVLGDKEKPQRGAAFNIQGFRSRSNTDNPMTSVSHLRSFDQLQSNHLLSLDARLVSVTLVLNWDAVFVFTN